MCAINNITHAYLIHTNTNWHWRARCLRTRGQTHPCRNSHSHRLVLSSCARPHNDDNERQQALLAVFNGQHSTYLITFTHTQRNTCLIPSETKVFQATTLKFKLRAVWIIACNSISCWLKWRNPVSSNHPSGFHLNPEILPTAPESPPKQPPLQYSHIIWDQIPTPEKQLFSISWIPTGWMGACRNFCCFDSFIFLWMFKLNLSSGQFWVQGQQKASREGEGM